MKNILKKSFLIVSLFFYTIISADYRGGFGNYNVNLSVRTSTGSQALDSIRNTLNSLSPQEAAVVALALIPTLYLIVKLGAIPGKVARGTYNTAQRALSSMQSNYNYLTDYLNQEQKDALREIKQKEAIQEYIKAYGITLRKIQSDLNLQTYTHKDIATLKEEVSFLKQAISTLNTLSAADRIELSAELQDIINALEIEQDRASYTLDPRYIGRQIKRAPGRLYNYMFGRTNPEAADQYIPANDLFN